MGPGTEFGEDERLEHPLGLLVGLDRALAEPDLARQGRKITARHLLERGLARESQSLGPGLTLGAGINARGKEPSRRLAPVPGRGEGDVGVDAGADHLLAPTKRVSQTPPFRA